MADTEVLVNQLNECANAHDFEGALKIVVENHVELGKNLQPIAIRDVLKSAANDRLIASLLDGVEFGQRPLDESLVRLQKLISFRQGSLVLSNAWGLGEVRRLDDFYKRITVDFTTKKGHQFTYAAAADMLESAPEGHILVMRKADPARFEALLKDKPGDFIKEVIKSYGDMTVTKLEDVCVANGFVKAVNWKKFWDAARAELKKDKLVEIPAKRAEPIRVKATVENYGDSWLMAFAGETDAKLILAAVKEFVSQGKFKCADETTKKKIGERLDFAVTAARKVDNALYARLACTVTELGFATPTATEMREYLWERKRFVEAAANLPAREVGEFLSFMAYDEAAKIKLCKAIPEFCFAAVSELIELIKDDASCREMVGAFMKEPKAPATLTTLIVGKYDKAFKDWAELPPLSTLLTHAIALGEGRQNGETLKMQNMVRRLFVDTKWLSTMFGLLDDNDRALLFERFQASIAWEASTHQMIVVRMMKIAPELEEHFVKVEKKKEYARITSPRSYAQRKREYLKLINEDMPANVRRIESAKSYGDLSENAEYQYAKDEQRALLQKQTLMQADLDAVKVGEFEDATTDEVMPGVTVTIVDNDGVEKVWTILGEWDNDLDRGIISSRTRMAENMMGKKVGDNFEMPNAEGNVAFATIKAIDVLTDEIREWMKSPYGDAF